MKRANGTGSVVKLSGSRRRPYAVRISGRDEHSHVIQRTLSYHATAREAQQALDEYNRNRASGAAPAVDKISMTLQQVYDLWGAREYPKMGRSATQSHKAAWNKRVSRYASRKFREISLDDWQTILDEAEDQGYSQSTIDNAAILIHQLSRFAMQRDIIIKDYSQLLDIPSVDLKHPRDALNDIQLAKLEQLVKASVPMADTALMLCYTGFRISEFLSLTRFSYHAENGGYLQNGFKTAAGKNRIVPVHPKIRPYLMAWLAKGGQTIICTENGTPISSNRYREIFSELMQQIGAPDATPHWCRHTFATKLHDAHVDLLTTKWLMGHSTKADITAHYTHQTIDILQDAILKLA